MRHQRNYIPIALGLVLLGLAGCHAETDQNENSDPTGAFELAGFVSNPVLDEISGIETTDNGQFYVHNDEGNSLLHIIDDNGIYQSAIKLEGAKNRDWEDLTSIHRENQRLLVVGDIGDNQARYKSLRLYFVDEPSADTDGDFPKKLEVMHQLKVRYPDGPRDCEALAYDASSKQLLFLTKRDKIPRLYGLSIDQALNQKTAELEFLAEVPTFSPPTAKEKLLAGKKALWLSQPTGMDISEDGSLAAVITYRSLYLYSREDGETWAEAFQKPPREFLGPPGVYDEAVTIDETTHRVYVTTEKVPTPLYHLPLP